MRSPHTGSGTGTTKSCSIAGIEAFACGQALAEFARLVSQFVVGKRRNSRLKGRNLGDRLPERLHITIVGRTEEGFGERADHENILTDPVRRPRTDRAHKYRRDVGLRDREVN